MTQASDPPRYGSGEAIAVRGARVHNLRSVDVAIPRDRLVVLTGVSGSGKSSLAFDTVHAEGQRRYIEGLSVSARQFLDQLQRPDVDEIEGLPPTVAVDQKAGQGNPRSTVATLTEIHDYLRLLFARVGTPHCPACREPIRHQTPERIVEALLGLPEGTRALLLAPLVRGRKGQHAEAFEAIRRAGLIRARVDGQVVEIESPPRLAKTKVHDIEAVVDRLVVRDGARARVAESVDRALELGEGVVVASIQQGEAWADRVFSTRFACPSCGIGFLALEPRTFSFNSPQGACPECDGLGTRSRFDPERIRPGLSWSFATGPPPVLEAFPARRAAELAAELERFRKRHRIPPATPFGAWPAAARDALLEGDAAFAGLLPLLEEQEGQAKSDARRSALQAYRSESPCPACGGARLRPEARAVTVGGLGIHAVCSGTIAERIPWFASLSFEPEQAPIGPPLVLEIRRRLEYLERVGVGYLTLDRRTDTLSGGELQRVRLASHVGSGLVGVAFVLDEPTAGLHPRDTDRLLGTLRDLRDAGNSVLVVEHDEATIRAADWVIDLGPGAGPDGGRVVAQGRPDELPPAGSVTARFLRDRPEIPPRSRDPREPGRPWVVIEGAAEHNLKGVTAGFPVGCLTCVTGVSGSGKSTLVLDVLGRAATRAITGRGPSPGAAGRIEGLDQFEKVVPIDQAPVGRTPRSTPATYVGIFDEIRKVFARTREAKVRGYRPSRFSFNASGGRCEVCQGQGVRRIAMRFLPDLEVVCEACRGQRFNPATLQARFKGLSIGDVLDLRVDEALAVFDAVPKVRDGLKALHEAGLGYVTLGQPSTTLSGGEAQRVKLAAELSCPSSGRTLYILDEPTTGLHAADVERLLAVLDRLAGQGHTLVIIEHNLDVIRAADWVIDLGPEGGAGGGHVVAAGPPEAIAREPRSATGAYLARLV
jgi:excinuclease ABC subunit A